MVWRPADWRNPHEMPNDDGFTRYTAEYKAFEAGADAMYRALGNSLRGEEENDTRA